MRDADRIPKYTGVLDRNGKELQLGDKVKLIYEGKDVCLGYIRFGRYNTLDTRDAYHIGWYIEWLGSYGISFRKELGFWADNRELVIVERNENADQEV